MNGEKKFLVVTVSLTITCATIAYSITFLALWPYRLWIALSFFALLVGVVIIFGLIKVQEATNEQQLRWHRVRFKKELPLAPNGVPLYLPPGAQPNTNWPPFSPSPAPVASEEQAAQPHYYYYSHYQQQQQQGGR
jgi:hypothetical protein